MSVSCVTCLVTGLDFHTIPDSLAPHSYGHPHWVSHPSRWSIDLLSWRCAVKCVSSPFLTAFSLLMKPSCLLVKDSTHADCCPCFQSFVLFCSLDESNNISTWVDPRFHFRLCLNLCGYTFACHCYPETPSVLGVSIIKALR